MAAKSMRRVKAYIVQLGHRVLYLQPLGAAILELDVTDTQENLKNIVSEAIGVYGRIDVLVNNAAYITTGTWEDLEYVLSNCSIHN